VHAGKELRKKKHKLLSDHLSRLDTLHLTFDTIRAVRSGSILRNFACGGCT